MTILLFEICTVLILSSSFSEQQSLPKILENFTKKSVPRQYPYHVQIVKESENCSSVFSGSLIDTEWILTSCAAVKSNNFLNDIEEERVKVIGGTTKFCNLNFQIRKVKEAVLYNKCLYSKDIALLLLDTPFHINKNLYIALLPSTSFLQGEEIDAIFNKCTVLGFVVQYQFRNDKEKQITETRMPELMQMELEILVENKKFLGENEGNLEENKGSVDKGERKDDDDKRNMKRLIERTEENELSIRKKIDENEYFATSEGNVKESNKSTREDHRREIGGKGWKSNENNQNVVFNGRNDGNVERYRGKITESNGNVYRTGWKEKRYNKEGKLFEETGRNVTESEEHEGRRDDHVVGGERSFLMSGAMKGGWVQVVLEDVGAPVMCGELQFGVVQSSFMKNGTLMVSVAQVDKYEVFLKAHVPNLLLQNEVVLDDGELRQARGDDVVGFRRRTKKSGVKRLCTTFLYDFYLVLLVILVKV